MIKSLDKMNCNHQKCLLTPFTTDGYCHTHRYWSNTSGYVTEHIFHYLSKINKTNGRKTKIKLSITLFNYLKYKKQYIDTHSHFKQVLVKKLKEYLEEDYSEIDEALTEKLMDSIANLKSIL